MDVAEINPRLMNAANLPPETPTSFVPMASVSEVNGSIIAEEERALSEVIKGFTYFQNGDVLVAKITPCFENGKIVHANIRNAIGFGSTEFHVVRANAAKLDSRYLFHYLRQGRIRLEGERKMTGSAGQRRVPRSFIENLRLRLPSLDEQRRIAAVLDKADALREKRRRAIEKLDSLLQSVFLDMFGDPVTNPKGWKVKKLGQIASFVGGGTPSRANPKFFEGDICWATSKDMKGEILLDTQEHITQEAIKQSATKLVPAGTILVVVKSKILLRYLPVLTTSVPACFGQDLKGIIPHNLSLTTYIARHIRVGQRSLLERARGVNTEGLTLEHLFNYKVMLPHKELIEQFTSIEMKLNVMKEKMIVSKEKADSHFHSLQQRAFNGELFNDDAGLDSPQHEMTAHAELPFPLR